MQAEPLSANPLSSVPVQVMVSLLSHAPSLVWAYVRDGETGLSELADEVEAQAHERPAGKFGKREARYLPQAPFPPTLWRTSCGRCRFWEEGEPGEPGTCHVVGREGDPYGGEAIHHRGWCALWMPPPGEPAFAWVRERLRPEGRESVRGEYDPEAARKERQRQVRADGLSDVDIPSPADTERGTDDE